MRILMVIGLVLLFCPPVIPGERDLQVEYLVGITSVSVAIDMIIDSDDVTLSKDRLVTDSELRLRLANVPVVLLEKGSNPRSSILFIHKIVVMSHQYTDGTYTGGVSFYVSSDVVQSVYVYPSERWTVAMTWSTDYMGFCKTQDLEEWIRDLVKDHSDDFANDYLAANAKESP